VFPKSLPLLIVAVLALIAGALFLLPRVQAPRVTERVTAEAIYSALQREADTTFVVTGYVDVIATVRSEDARVFLPNILNLPLGTTRATVRVPGRISYGFDMDQLTPDLIRVRGDTVEIDLPLVSVYAAEPDMGRLEVETTTGWARLPVTAQEAERRAVQRLSETLRVHGERHLAGTAQPKVNTARALRRLVEPVVVGLGMEAAHYRVYLGEGLLLEP
jgi:hypothetical protein